MARVAKEIVEEAHLLKVPLTVPEEMAEMYRQNYLAATASTGRLLLFAGDQKIEHLNRDFYGEGIAAESGDPQHLFEIAKHGRIGVFATQLGLIARYAYNYKDVNYVVKMNSKTDLMPTSQQDPYSSSLVTVDQVVAFRERTGLKICGVGYTVYLGSSYESYMLQEAAAIIYQAHIHGMIAVLWMYPRGKAVANERDPDVIAGAAGVAACLGADFVKINLPEAKNSFRQAELLQQAARAAGRTKVICSGGSLKNENDFLTSLYHQIHVGGICGAAIGRNIHQKPLAKAVAFCQALAAIIFDDGTVEEAQKLLIE